MDNTKRSQKPIEFQISVNLTDGRAAKFRLAAYVFSRSGRLVAKEPIELKEGQGAIHIKIKEVPQKFLIKVGPEVEDLRDLSIVQTVSRMAVAAPPEKVVLDFAIPKPGWICWLKVPYLVTGTVSKNGEPICAGEVDIYEVDFKTCLWKLPELVIERIRDAIIDVIVDPPPFELPEIRWDILDDDYCGTVPRPPFPPKRVLNDKDIAGKLETFSGKSAIAQQRFANLENVRSSISADLLKMSLSDRQTFLNREAVDGVSLGKLLHTTTKQFRELLVENVMAFRFWLCWPWIYLLWWPYCYSWAKIGTAELQSDGSFSKTIYLSVCNKDTPDLWFIVKQNINGSEKVIYARHPIPCHTFWNHPSGDPVHLMVTDPDAIACFKNPSVDKPGLYVMPLGIGNDGWYEIHQAHVIPPAPLSFARGLYHGTDPYGTDLDIQMQIHEGLRGIGVKYYRWSFRREGTMGWTHIDKPITHRYLTLIGGDPFIKSESLGPDSIGSEANLFEIPDPTHDWVIINRADRRFAHWETKDLTDGRYELKLEMFDDTGAKVIDPITKGFKYFLPLSEAVGNVWPVEDSPHVESGGSIIFRVRIDNQDTVAKINSVGLGVSSFIGECQFLEYTDFDHDDVAVNYLAYHPSDFLRSYSINVRRGKSGTSVAAYSSVTPASPPSGETKTFPVKDLLGTYGQCAFSVQLHTYPRTRDGYSPIREYESHAVAAFALVPASP